MAKIDKWRSEVLDELHCEAAKVLSQNWYQNAAKGQPTNFPSTAILATIAGHLTTKFGTQYTAVQVGLQLRYTRMIAKNGHIYINRVKGAHTQVGQVQRLQI